MLLPPHSLPLAVLAAAAIFVAPARASPGCNLSSSPWQFDSTGHANQTIGDRWYYVHLPPSYQQNVSHPVVLSYHGYGESAPIQEYISGLSDDSLRINNTGIISVYPQGAYGPGRHGNESVSAWQGAPYAAPGVNDIDFTLDVLQDLQSNLCVDTDRIYASGKSEGGGFTNLLACKNTTSSVIAAFAPMSAALYEGTLPFDGCDTGAMAVPIINFHGLADQIVPYGGRFADKEGNRSYALPNITIWRETWGTRNGCPSQDASRVSDVARLDYTAYVWDCSQADARAVIHGYSVAGLGHSWPSTLGLDKQKTPFNATNEYIVPFFDLYTLDVRPNASGQAGGGGGGQNASSGSSGAAGSQSGALRGSDVRALVLPGVVSCALALLSLL
ncbi:hypothetical protein AcW2_007466 [Taiwanofungus camphoratus]|nr:hypothetical protein AcW2_007466 [Antrodia cinnamomea]